MIESAIESNMVKVCADDGPFNSPHSKVYPLNVELLTCAFISFLLYRNHYNYIKSESRGQEEAGRTQQTSELFTRSTALKFENALNKPP